MSCLYLARGKNWARRAEAVMMGTMWGLFPGPEMGNTRITHFAWWLFCAIQIEQTSHPLTSVTLSQKHSCLVPVHTCLLYGPSEWCEAQREPLPAPRPPEQVVGRLVSQILQPRLQNLARVLRTLREMLLWTQGGGPGYVRGCSSSVPVPPTPSCEPTGIAV